MTIFWTFSELHFSGLKRILFYPEYHKMFLSGFFCSKNLFKKKKRFFDKNHGLTPLQNVVFFYLARTLLLRSKKLYFLSRISKNVSFWLFLLKKKHIRKRSIFDKNQGPFPLQNVDFFRPCENFTFEVQKALFSIQNIKKCFFLAFFAKKKTYKKKVDF